MGEIQDRFEDFRSWVAGQDPAIRVLAWFTAVAIAIVLVVPAAAIWLTRQGSHRVVHRLVPAVLILAWGLIVIPVIAGGGDPRDGTGPDVDVRGTTITRASIPTGQNVDPSTSEEMIGDAPTTTPTIPLRIISSTTTPDEPTAATSEPIVVATTLPQTTTSAVSTTRGASTSTTAAAPTTTRAPTTTATAAPTAPGQGWGCHPAYIDCVPAHPDDVDCAGGSGNGPVYVRGPIRLVSADNDPYGLDGNDNDGIGCEG